MRTYSEMIKFKTLRERFEYLKLDRQNGYATFGHQRYLNQILYASDEWKSVRAEVIIRDGGCDLGIQDYVSGDVKDYLIHGVIYVHHIDPITVEDILNNHPKVLSLDNLISTSSRTHKAIHFGLETLLPQQPVVRSHNDTCPWRK